MYGDISTNRHIATASRAERRLAVIGEQLDVEAERLELFDQHIERLWETRFEGEVSVDDRFVHARTTQDVVGFDGEYFL